MQSKGQIWLSCLLGGIIGGALTFAGHLQYHFSLTCALPFGMLIGGVIAYLLYDLADVKAGVSRAYRDVYGKKSEICRFVKLACRFAFWGTAMVHTIFSNVIIVGVMTIPLQDLYFLPAEILVILFSWIWFLAGSSEGGFTATKEKETNGIIQSIKTGVWKYANPLAITFWIAFGLVCLPIATYIAITKIPKAIKLSGRFAKTAFRYIHTQRRLIVMIDTAIGILFGVALGIHFDNPLLGTLACGAIGAILGEVNYRVVSLRWLKLQPA